MQQKHYPAHDLASVVRGASINCIVRLKPATGFGKEDVKITGNMIALLDVNNRISEEYEVPEIYDGSVSNENIFKQSMIGYLRGLISGINICIFGFGSTGSGKTYTVEGEENEAGLIGYFSDAMFQEMEQKKTEMNQGKHFVQQQGLSFSVRIRYIEIVDEEVSDLLLHTAARMQSLQIGMDEWEGNTVLNASWMKTPSAEHLVDAFQLAKRTRCNRMDEHGNPLH